MSDDMRTVIWDAPGHVSLQQRPVPTPGDGEVLVEVLTNGLCSTDYPIVAGQVAGSWPGMILGHEPVARVIALGKGVSHPQIGDRVILDTMIACGTCRFCQEGHTELCAHSDEIGFSVDGNWSDFAVLPAANLHVLPDTIGDLAGTTIEALTCQMGGVEALNVGFGESAVIVGSGLAALTFVQLLRLRGAGHVAVVMRDYADRMALARQFGADQIVTPDETGVLRTAGRIAADDGFDITIDAVGTMETTLTTLGLARRGGRVLLYGLRSAHVDRFPIGDTIFRNLTLYGHTSAPWLWQAALDLVGRGQLQTDVMVGGVIELEEVPALLNGPRQRGGPLKRVIRVRGN